MAAGARGAGSSCVSRVTLRAVLLQGLKGCNSIQQSFEVQRSLGWRSGWAYSQTDFSNWNFGQLVSDLWVGMRQTSAQINLESQGIFFFQVTGEFMGEGFRHSWI